MPSPFDRGSRPDGPPGASVLSAVPQDPRSSALSYEPFYGLKEQPFSLSPDPRFFYRSRFHAIAFEDLLNAIERREPLMVVTGDVGTGKTTLCRAVLTALDREPLIAAVPDPTVSPEDFLKGLLADFGAASCDEVAGQLHAASRTELRYLLREHLRPPVSNNAPVIVLIDEAQKLSGALAAEVSMLLDDDGSIQVLLVGQLELANRLAAHDMRRLDQRASARCTLAPLDRAGVAGYITHRVQKAGATPDRLTFSDDAIDAISGRSTGVPRLVNRLCDRALAIGYARRAFEIDHGMVEAGQPAAVPTAPPVPGAPGPAVVPEPVPQFLPEPLPASSMPSAEAILPSGPAIAVAAALAAPRPGAAAESLDAWLTGLDNGAIPQPTRLLVEPLPTAPDSEAEEAYPATAYDRAGSVVVVRIRWGARPRGRRHRRAERRTDRWARRLGNVLLTVTLVVGAAAFAPTIIDIVNDLWSQIISAFSVSP